MLILNISIITIFSAIYLSKFNTITRNSIGIALILFAIIMFITIQKSLQIYYKQKLLVQELEETKNELEKKNKEIKELEQENLNFSKTSHTLAHKQKALEYKLNQLINQSAKNEPTKNAAKLAMTIRGASPKIKLKLSAPSQNGAAGNQTASCPIPTTKKIHQKATPNNQACFFKSPHLRYAIINNIRHRENQQSASNRQTKQINNLGFQKICRYKAYIKNNTQQHVRYRNFLFH